MQIGLNIGKNYIRTTEDANIFFEEGRKFILGPKYSNILYKGTQIGVGKKCGRMGDVCESDRLV